MQAFAVRRKGRPCLLVAEETIMRWFSLALLSVLLTLGAAGPTRADALIDEVAALNAR